MLGVDRTCGVDHQTDANDPSPTSASDFDIGINGASTGIRQFGLMPETLITLAHFSVSSAISFPNSAGDPGSTTPPRSARRAFILGSSRAALTSLLSLSTISAGVAFGAPTPHQMFAS